MGRRRAWAVIGGLVLVAFASGQAAAANETFQFRGMGAFGFFNGGDGCWVSQLDVNVLDRAIKQTGTQQTTDRVGSFNWFAADTCNGGFVVGGGDLTAPAFKANLNTATLSAAVTVFVWDGVTFSSAPANLSVTWTSTGETFKGLSHFITRSGDMVQHARSIGTTATATGTAKMSVGTQTFTLSGSGSISDNDNGSVTIMH